jgi:hypothetical protein
MPSEEPNPRTPDDDSLIKGGNWFSKRMENVICRVTPSCTEMTHLLSREMDQPLPWFTRLQMRIHFLMCCYCRRYMESLRYLRRIFRSPESGIDQLSSERLSPEAKERLKETLRGQRL